MEMLLDTPIMLFESQKAWEQWLDKYGTQPQGVWLKIAKKNSGVASVTYLQAVEGALCYGWIDGQKRSYDGTFFLQKFTPRRQNSVWSKINVDKIAVLTQSGKMKPAGIAAVEAAKQNGRWQQAYESPSNMTVPADFQAELAKNPLAKQSFEGLNKTERYSYLWRIQTAKKPETRQTRITAFITLLNKAQQTHPKEK